MAERLLWAELRKLKMNIRRQAPIGPYVADFVHHPTRLVIEIDGYYHGAVEAQARDEARDRWLATAGYRVMRFSDAEVRDQLFQTAERIESEISRSPSL